MFNCSKAFEKRCRYEQFTDIKLCDTSLVFAKPRILMIKLVMLHCFPSVGIKEVGMLVTFHSRPPYLPSNASVGCVYGLFMYSCLALFYSV